MWCETPTAADWTVLGEPALLGVPATGLFCSTRTPAELYLPTLDWMMAASQAGLPVVGPFQSPLERNCLELALGLDARLIVFPARTVAGRPIPDAWTKALEAGRLAIVGAVEDRGNRPTRELARRRNRAIVHVCERLFVPYARPGSLAFEAAAKALELGRSIGCFEHRANRDLILLGASAVDPVDGIQPVL